MVAHSFFISSNSDNYYTKSEGHTEKEAYLPGSFKSQAIFSSLLPVNIVVVVNTGEMWYEWSTVRQLV